MVEELPCSLIPPVQHAFALLDGVRESFHHRGGADPTATQGSGVRVRAQGRGRVWGERKKSSTAGER